MIELLYLALFVVVVFLCVFAFNKGVWGSEGFLDSDPCQDKLTDVDYLLHMIPHHKVAVDISYMLQKTSKSDVMQDILRKLIWTQNYEITLMNDVLSSFPEINVSATDIMNKRYIDMMSDFISPNKLGLTNTYCDPHFFNPEEHMKHLEGMKLDEKIYLQHMIPHHQVAVDMSKKLLKHTTNDFMIYLAYRIIRSQQEEIIMLNDLLNEKNKFYDSSLL